MTTSIDIQSESGGQVRQPHAELLDARQVARLLNCSVRHVYRLSDAGRMPRPLKLGSLVRWRNSELADWVKAGCPRCRSPKRADR